MTGVRGSGTSALRYQWRRNGIQGADKPWLKLDHVSLADDGSRYTVRVGAGEAPIESRPGALRVAGAATALNDD